MNFGLHCCVFVVHDNHPYNAAAPSRGQKCRQRLSAGPVYWPKTERTGIIPTTQEHHHSSEQKKGGDSPLTHPPTRMQHVLVQQCYFTTAVRVLKSTRPTDHAPNHRPSTAAQQHVQQQYVRTFMQRSFLHRHVFTIPRRDGSSRPPYV